MTRKELEEYRSNKEEIKELQYKLFHLGEGDSMMGNDTILDYRSGYPMPQSVVGVDWDKVDRLEKRYEDKIKALEKACERTEDFIESIPDGITRRICRMHYIDGLPQKSIAKELHMEKSSVSKRISKYLQLSPNSSDSIL